MVGSTKRTIINLVVVKKTLPQNVVVNEPPRQRVSVLCYLSRTFTWLLCLLWASEQTVLTRLPSRIQSSLLFHRKGKNFGVSLVKGVLLTLEVNLCTLCKQMCLLIKKAISSANILFASIIHDVNLVLFYIWCQCFIYFHCCFFVKFLLA